MLKKMRKNGLIAVTLMDMWAFILFAVIAVVFLLLFYISRTGIEQKTTALSGKINAEAYFLNFLKTPVKIDWSKADKSGSN